MSEYSFDEQYVIDFIKEELNSVFSSEDWRRAFGGKDVIYTEDNFGARNSFPVIYIEVTNRLQRTGTEDSSLEEKYTRFWFNIEHYNQAVGKTQKTKLGIRINEAIVDVLRKNLNPTIISNSKIVSPDNSIYRRSIEGYCSINNKTKTFYK